MLPQTEPFAHQLTRDKAGMVVLIWPELMNKTLDLVALHGSSPLVVEANE